MHDDEPMIDYEEHLRHALQRVPTPDSDADAFLNRVEHGVRRRVRRRRVATASLGAAAVLAAAAVVVPGLDTDDSHVADPAHGPDSDGPGHANGDSSRMANGTPGGVEVPNGKQKTAAGKLTDPDDLSVSAVATNASGAVSVIGKSDCPDGPCVVTGSPTSSHAYRIAPTGDRLLRPMTATTKATAATEPGIQVGSDAANSWAWTDRFYSTHDAGRTWAPVDLPTTLRVEYVESTGERVWAFGRRGDGRAVVASSAEHTDNWVNEPVPVGADESIDTPMVVDDRVAFVATERAGNEAELVRERNGAWDRSALTCPEPVTSSGASDTVWIGCRTPNGSDFVTWSHDDGAKWNYAFVDRPGLSAVGGVDSDTAVAAVGEDLYVVESGGDLRPAAAPYDATDPVWDGPANYDSIRIGKDGTGYATTNGGALAHTVDGGRTWQAKSLP